MNLQGEHKFGKQLTQYHSEVRTRVSGKTSWPRPRFAGYERGGTAIADLAVTVTDRVAVLTFNRPERRNAYTAEMGALLNRAYREFDDDDDVRAIVLTGAGDAFCAGADFSGTASPFDTPSAEVEFTASPTDPAAFELRTPVIAAVNGHAIGIGLTIALQADIRIMAQGAKYAVAQVRRGVIPDCMSHWTLPHLAGGAVAADILLTGRTFDGVEAVAMGIASRTAPGDQVLELAMTVARDIADNVAPMSAALSKRLLWDTMAKGYSPRQVADLETKLHHRVMGSADAREGVEAFMQRRTPRWTASVSREWEPLPDV
jgi:enoyl-CoA hydratase/carnithine racemase